MIFEQSNLSDVERNFLDNGLSLISDQADKNEPILEKIIAYIISLTLLAEAKSSESSIFDHIQKLPSVMCTVDLLDRIFEFSESTRRRGNITKKLVRFIKAEKNVNETKIDKEKLLRLHNLVPFSHHDCSFNLNLGSRLLSLVVENFSVSSWMKKKRGTYYTLPTDADLISLLSSYRFLQQLTQKMTDEDLLSLLISKTTEKSNLFILSGFPSEITILDPTCGSGIFLVHIAQLLGELGIKTGRSLKISLWGMDLDPVAIMVTQLRLFFLEFLFDAKLGSHSIQITTSLSCGDFLTEKFDQKFDLIVGNPPYVRHEDIGIKNSPDYKKSLQRKFSDFLEPNIRLDRKSDYLIYFCLKSISLLSSKGVLAFLTSNAWLEVKYGKTLQDQLIALLAVNKLSTCEIIHQAGSRFWKQLGINSVIFLASKKVKKGVLSNSIFFTESVKTLNKIPVASLKNGVIFCREYSSENYRTEAIAMVELKSTHKWAGTFLRASKEERGVLQKIEEQESPLSRLANVQFGIKTGANDFFHVSVEKVNEKKSSVEIKSRSNFRGRIESEFLFPLVKSPVECKGYVIPPKFTPKVWLFNCQKPLDQLKRTGALTYIQWGESNQVPIKQGRRMGSTVKGFHLLRSLSQRDPWYALPTFSIPDLVWIKSYHDKPGCLLNRAKSLPDQRFYGITVNDSKDIPVIFAYLNSSFVWAQMEQAGNTNMGFGVLDTNVYWLKSVRIPTNLTLKQNQDLTSLYNDLINETSRTSITTVSYLREQIDKFFAMLLGISDEELSIIFQFIQRSVDNRLKGNTKDN